MAKPNQPLGMPDTPTTVGYDDTQFEWDNVHEEAPDQIVFDVIGDTYVGSYQGSEVIEWDDSKGEHQTFTQLKFRDPDGLKVINAGFELGQAFEKITAGSMTRIRLVKFVDVGAQSPMKSYRVDVAKPVQS